MWIHCKEVLALAVLEFDNQFCNLETINTVFIYLKEKNKRFCKRLVGATLGSGSGPSLMTVASW